MERQHFCKLNIGDFSWLNEPQSWKVTGDSVEVITDNGGDFWQGTWYNFHFNTGHFYGVEVKDDFTFSVSFFKLFTYIASIL